MHANWEIIRNFQSCPARLLAICMNFTLILMISIAYTNVHPQTSSGILCIWHLDCLCYIQNRALLNTLWILHSTGGSGHITVFNTLAISHTKHPTEHRISSWLFAVKKWRGSNRQDFVFIHPPGISHGDFELRMDNVWFFKVLLLFQMEKKTFTGWKRHSCAFVSVMEEHTDPWWPSIILSLIIILRLLIVLIKLSSLALYQILLCSIMMVGPMRLNYYLWTPHAVPSSVCHPSYFHIG
jgi:hypothetical protein